MGQILSNPIIDKEHHAGSDILTAFGLCAMQGWRMSMEDAHVCTTNLNNGEDEHVAYYAVFDGHGGASVAAFCGEKADTILSKQKTFKDKNYAQALIDAFIASDEEILRDPVLKNDHSGCTATTVLISKLKQKIICANAGDSRTVLSTGKLAKALSFDHKPTLKSERSRILAADGFVEMDRVNGNLALSRAIGDFEFKSNSQLPPHEQIVTCVPDIMEHSLNYDKDEFVVLACDGIWDCLSSQECVDLVHYGISKGDMSLEQIASRIVDVCCSPTTEGTGIGCDNMSIVIVALLKEGESLDTWFKRIRDKKYSTPTSFESARRAVFSYYDFPNNDEEIFAVSTKKADERYNNSYSSNEDEDEDMDRDDTPNVGHSHGSGAQRQMDLFSLEALLGSGGIQITQGENNMSYLHGSALSEVLASLSGATGGVVTAQEEEEEEEEEAEENEREGDGYSGKIEEIKEAKD